MAASGLLQEESLCQHSGLLLLFQEKLFHIKADPSFAIVLGGVVCCGKAATAS